MTPLSRKRRLSFRVCWQMRLESLCGEVSETRFGFPASGILHEYHPLGHLNEVIPISRPLASFSPCCESFVWSVMQGSHSGKRSDMVVLDHDKSSRRRSRIGSMRRGRIEQC